MNGEMWDVYYNFCASKLLLEECLEDIKKAKGYDDPPLYRYLEECLAVAQLEYEQLVIEFLTKCRSEIELSLKVVFEKKERYVAFVSSELFFLGAPIHLFSKEFSPAAYQQGRFSDRSLCTNCGHISDHSSLCLQKEIN